MAQLALEARRIPYYTGSDSTPVASAKFEQYTNPEEDPWVKGYRDWEQTMLRFPAGPKAPAPYV